MVLEQLVTKREVSAATRYHAQTIMRLVREGRFPNPIKVHGAKSAVRWRARDIAAWIDERVGAAAPHPEAMP
jgi:predicted DNA-binding transcriptional regulator AlpA